MFPEKNIIYIFQTIYHIIFFEKDIQYFFFSETINI